MKAAQVSVLLRAGPLDEALTALDALADEATRNPPLRYELDLAREEFVKIVVARLGGPEAHPHAEGSCSTAVSKDAAYAFSVAKEAPSLGELLRRSVLGRFRTARALHELLGAGSLVSRTTPRQAPPRPRQVAVEEVVVGDASPSQAAILRTLLRVVLKQSPPFRTVESTEALRSSCRDRKPRLIVVDAGLPGASLRGLVGDLARSAHNSVLIVGSAVDLDHLRPELPGELGFLARPFDRSTLASSLRELGLVTG